MLNMFVPCVSAYAVVFPVFFPFFVSGAEVAAGD